LELRILKSYHAIQFEKLQDPEIIPRDILSEYKILISYEAACRLPIKISETMQITVDLETVSHFSLPKPRKSQKMYPKRFRGKTQNDPTVDKNGHLDLQVPVGCPCGPLDH